MFSYEIYFYTLHKGGDEKRDDVENIIAKSDEIAFEKIKSKNPLRIALTVLKKEEI